jgi:hypothetical protein
VGWGLSKISMGIVRTTTMFVFLVVYANVIGLRIPTLLTFTSFMKIITAVGEMGIPLTIITQTSILQAITSGFYSNLVSIGY